MKTKLILHGGFARDQNQENDLFFQEMLRDAPEKPKVLLVYFASSEYKIPRKAKQDTEQFNKNKRLKDIQLRTASKETFRDDVAWADVIYLRGGKTIELLEYLKAYPSFPEMISGKIVGGDSAGANALSTLCYSKNSKEIMKGMGVLPIKLVTHYQEGQLNPFEDIAKNLETVFLSEYEMKIYEIENKRPPDMKSGGFGLAGATPAGRQLSVSRQACRRESVDLLHYGGVDAAHTCV